MLHGNVYCHALQLKLVDTLFKTDDYWLEILKCTRITEVFLSLFTGHKMLLRRRRNNLVTLKILVINRILKCMGLYLCN